MKLRYKAATSDGKLSQGLLDAKDINEAADYLRAKNLVPITIEKTDSNLLTLPFFKKVKQSDLVLFTRQLSSMLSSGLTLFRALEILREQMQNPQMTEVVSSLISEVQDGKTLAQALEKHPQVFSTIYVSIIRAGEKSGLLDKVLLRLADNLEKQAKLKSTVKGALMYPVIVIILMIVVMSIMMIFVIPQLTVLYTNLNVELPLPTKIVVGISNFMIAAWPLILLGGAAVVIGFRKWAKTPDGKILIDTALLKVPIFGKLITQTILAEFSRTFGLLVGTGTLVVQALNETADTTGNTLFKNAIFGVSKQVEKGVTVGDSMAYYPLFPPLLIQLVKIGEQTGKIDDTLIKASEYFEREVDQTVKTLTTAMEPFIMVVLGIGVAFLIISVITPIYSLISSIQ
ncbi:MAG: type II secretion system F family protein [Patescibacteria group bacterium]|nr:type II secretion system F family protein [Actinomycetota bacterium]MCL5969886.1 type II secretion system F family protein [Patescibacteria group bacterium]